MSVNAGTVSAYLELEISKFTQQLANAEARLNRFENNTQSTSKRISELGNRMAGFGKSMTTFVSLPIMAAGAAAIKLASDTNESLNKVDVAFKNNAKEVKAWSNTTLKSYGIARGTALDMVSLYGDMSTSMGLNTREAAKMSMSLVGLAGDLSSFKNIDIEQATNALNSIFSGETEPLKRLGVVMTELNLKQFAYSQGIKKKMKEMTQAEKVQLRYNYVMAMTKNAQGDFERTQAGTANQMRIFTESLKELGATMGQHLLPLITPIINRVNTWIQSFGQLDEKTQKTILAIAGITAVIGPVIVGVGTLVSSVGAITGALGLFTPVAAGAAGATAAVGGSALAIAGPIGIAVAAIAGLTIAGIALYKHLKKEVIPEVDLFGDTTSEATKKAVGGYMELDNKATQCLMNLKINGGKISKQTAKNQIAIYDDMGKQIKEGIQKKFDESYNIMKAFFEKNNKLSTAEEQKILNNMVSDNEKKQKEIDKYTKRVDKIYANAKKHHGIMSQAEQKELAQIEDKMKKSAIKNLSQTKTEANTILEKMKQNAGNISARQAAEVVKNSATQRDKTINNAKKECSGTVSAIENMRDNTKSISKKQADTLIKDAERQRDQSVKKAQQMHSQVVAEAKKQAAGHVSQVDWETGRIITNWDRVVDKVISAMSWLSKLSLFGATGKVAAGIEEVKKQKAGQIGKNAKGTDYWRGGWTWTGEEGPELMYLPQGTQIYSNPKSKAMLQGLNNFNDIKYLIRDELKRNAVDTGTGVTINIGSAVIREEADIKKVATELYRITEKEKRARGIR